MTVKNASLCFWRNVMFFSRLGTASDQSKELSADIRRRRIAVLGLAVAVTTPAGLFDAQRTYAQVNTAQPPAMTSGEILRQGVDQLNKSQFEESLATLRHIKTEDVST